ncbi:MAG: hypothetical protein HF982_14345 [Desulfobacteraceae bacterium]|nr:hypothetical protein [Desulfobacteraceae bacterium]MBC2720738.1 hypothetical protein [Desulfobacteraceae bacterium]
MIRRSKMKRFCLVSVMVLACTLFFAQGSGAFLGVGPDGEAVPVTIDIMYDGYCDGARLTYDLTTGLASGNQTGCCQGYMLGAVADVYSQGPALCMSYCAGADFYAHPLYTVIRIDKTWTHYACDGNGGMFVLNSGTWSYGAADAADGSLPSSLGQ